MGFNLGGAFQGAVSGAFTGASVAGPYGAIAGGVIGGVAGGFGGGPSSAGGITGGRQAGQQASEYYDAAFPGTNPWERLGAGNPMGQMVSAGVAAKAATRNVDKQTTTLAANTVRQTQTQQKVAAVQAGSAVQVAKIHGAASALSTAQNYPPGSAPGMIKMVTDPDSITGSGVTAPGAMMRGAGSKEVAAAASKSQAESARGQLLVSAERAQTEKGKAFVSPEKAALAARAVQTFDYGSRDPNSWDKHLSRYFNVYLAAGVAAHTIREGANAVSSALGARVRGVGAGGNRFPRKTSVRGGR